MQHVHVCVSSCVLRRHSQGSGPRRAITLRLDPLIVLLLRQVAVRTSKAGTTAFMKGRSFGVFGIRNRLRLLVFRVMFSQVKQRPDPAHIAATAYKLLKLA